MRPQIEKMMNLLLEDADEVAVISVRTKRTLDYGYVAYLSADDEDTPLFDLNGMHALQASSTVSLAEALDRLNAVCA